MKNIWLRISIAVAYLSLAAALTATATDELKIVYNVGVAPLKFEDATSRPAGLFPDLWRLWAQKAGKKIEFVKVDSFDKSLQLLKDGNVDLHAGLFRTPAREKFLDYSEPLLALDYYIFTHPSVYPIKSLEKTSGFIVGIQKGGYTEKFVRSKVPANRISVYDRFQDLFRAALEGEIRVFVATELSLLYYLKENFQTNIFEYDRDHPLYSQVYYSATKKGNPALIQQVNDGLKAIGSQERKQLEDKWIVLDFNEISQVTSDAVSEAQKIALTDAEKEWLAAHNKIVVGGEKDWAPFDFVDQTGEYAGIADDYLKIIGEKLGIKVEMVTGPSWDELLSMLRRKEIDVLPAIYHAEEREAYAHFTAPYIKITEFIFGRSDNQTISSFEDLKDQTIVVVKGYTIEGYLRSNYPDYDLIAAPTIQDALKKLVTGDADAFIGDIISTSYNIKELSLIGIKPIAQVPIRGPHVHMAVRKDWPVLRNLIDKTLEAIPANEHEAIKKRWITIAEKKIEQGRPKIALTAQEGTWLEKHPVIRVHNEKDWPPFNYFEYSSPRGLSIDYMNLVAEQLGIKVEYVTGPSWNEFLGMVKRKELDVMLNIVKTEDRMKYLLYTEPYIKNPNVIVSLQKSPYETIEALFGKTVAFPKGFFYEEVLTKSFPRIKRLPVEDTLSSLKAVTFGRADAALGEAAVMRTLINKNLLTGLQISGEVNIGDPDLTNLRLGVRNDWPLLQSALMKAMAAVSPQDMNQIRQKWIVADAETTRQETAVPISYGRMILYGIAVFLILILLAWILIKTIQKENIAVNFGTRWFRGLVLAGLSIFVIIVCLLGWFTLEQNREQILAGIGENLTETLKTADDRLNLWVEQRTLSLKLLGRDPELVALTKRLLAVPPNREDLLASGALQDTRVFFNNNENILSNIGFFIVDSDHVSIGSMSDNDIGTRNPISLQQPRLLKRAYEGEVLFVPPIESNVSLGKVTGVDRARNLSANFFMGSIQDSNGQIIALIALHVDLSEDLSRILPSSEARKTGETYAFSEHGELLSESRFDDQLRRIGLLAEDQKSAFNIEIRDPGVNLISGELPKKDRSKQPLTRMAAHAIQLKLAMEKTGQTYGRSKIEIDTKGYRDYRGVPVFGAWLWSAELGIGLATEIDVKEAMSIYYQVRRTVFGVLGFTLLLSIGAVLLVLILGERTSQALRKSRDELELRVQERTAELRESEIKLRTIFEKSPLGILHIGKDGIVLDCNDRHAEIMGSSREKIIGMNLRKEIENDQLRAAVFGALAGEQTEFEAEYTSVSGERTILVRSIFNPTEPGTSPTEVINTTEDITERKRAEEAVKKSEREYRTLFENASVGILVAQDQMFRFVNPQMEKLLAYKQSELMSRSIIDFFHPDDRNMIQERHEKRLKGESMPDVYNTRIVDRYGNTKWIEVKVVPIQWDDRPAALGFMTDITERKRAEDELNRNVDELERFNKLAIGRELKMIQLKEEINELLGQSNQDKRYKIVK